MMQANFHCPTIKLALVDDHKLFRKGLRSLIEVASSNSQIIFEADNGIHLQQQISQNETPDIILMDVSMPKMDGFESVKWLSENYPSVNVLVVSMIEKEESIVRMLRMGVKGYLSKDVEPKELGEALNSIHIKGYYYTDFITGKLIHSLRYEDTSSEEAQLKNLNEREIDFLKWSCSELTYQEIAERMFLSPKTIDGYRNILFEKLNIKSRVGLALFAVKVGLVNL